MGSSSGETFEWDALSSTSGHEDKIVVSVRLRPLNERELANNDVSDWECINDTTIIFKNTFQERSLLPNAYTFDRVFGADSPTKQVYEEAAQNIALSVLSGINSTIFAYGQTSSGKTYTMSGITEYAVEDIYEYVEKHREREFVLKFSAMEIYNELVRDLLSTDDTALRLLDDPERGTVVEKLTEVTLRDSSHLKDLLSLCDSQRQIGETTLNEMSSRSHQILRLAVESEAREYFGAENSTTLTASVNFVDLAGSERASQTLSAGSRLKEGCHINRSLLTLGTVIRKLSKGKNGHIPYRDSKLTRILQNSLGGNAKTAVICTMSPAHAHVEQSRNTLLFGNCAKHISTNAQVNVVMSEKALVRQLQRELIRLENELRGLSSLAASADSTSALKEKELLIEKMDIEIKELTHQRDLAQSRLEKYLCSEGENPASKFWVDTINHEKNSWMHENSASEASHFSNGLERINSRIIEDKFLENNEDEFLTEDTSPTLYIDKYFGPEMDKNFEDKFKGVQCIEIDFTKRNTISHAASPSNGAHHSVQSPFLSDEDVPDPSPDLASSSKPVTGKDNTSQDEADKQKMFFDPEPTRTNESLSTKNCRSSTRREVMNGEEQNVTILGEDSIIKPQGDCLIRDFNEVINPELMKQSADDLKPEDGKASNNPAKLAEYVYNKAHEIKESDSDWSIEFERQKREIIELWDSCNIPLVHRTYFFLLFKGDPSDAVYMEVELRRLSFLKNALHGVRVIKDDQSFTRASSAKALYGERKMLSKQMLKKFSRKEREVLYKKWGINLKSKRRRLQLSRRLWTDVTTMEHIKESASIVARLVGFKELGQAPKEMFALSLSLKPVNLKSFNWRQSLPPMI